MAVVGVVVIGRIDVRLSDVELIMRMTAMVMAMRGSFIDARMERR